MKVSTDSKYSKSIQEFIALVMNDPKSMKINKFGKKFKSYADAAKLYAKQTNKEQTKPKNDKMSKETRASENDELFTIVQSLNNQVKMLNNLMIKLCSESENKHNSKNEAILQIVKNPEYIKAQ